jgi:hypothetical protein
MLTECEAAPHFSARNPYRDLESAEFLQQPPPKKIPSSTESRNAKVLGSLHGCNGAAIGVEVLDVEEACHV